MTEQIKPVLPGEVQHEMDITSLDKHPLKVSKLNWKQYALWGTVALGTMSVLYCLKPDEEKITQIRKHGLDLAQRKPVAPLKKLEEMTQQVGAISVETTGGHKVPAPDVPATHALRDSFSGTTDTLSENDAEQRKMIDAQRQEKAQQVLEMAERSGIYPPNFKLEERAALAASAPSVNADSPKDSVANDVSAPDVNRFFQQSLEHETVNTSVATQIHDMALVMLQGKRFSAKIQEGLHSDLPGDITAMIDADAYGEQGRIKLLPWGTKLFGRYNATIRKGQNRIYVVWTRAVRPDGIQVMLGAAAGVDQLGRSGVEGEVDNHWGQVIGTSAILSILGIGSATVGVQPTDNNNSASMYRQTVQQGSAQGAANIMGQYASIAPTIVVKPGQRIQVILNRDLDFSSVLHPRGGKYVAGQGVQK
ncbi:MAG: TrbI/VirB10 family protein [Ottowia sp.]|nr:TrbI/VirB10 family protein [Ottowia sp.]